MIPFGKSGLRRIVFVNFLLIAFVWAGLSGCERKNDPIPTTDQEDEEARAICNLQDVTSPDYVGIGTTVFLREVIVTSVESNGQVFTVQNVEGCGERSRRYSGVRVDDEDGVLADLDAADKGRGALFLPVQLHRDARFGGGHFQISPELETHLVEEGDHRLTHLLGL